MENKINGYEYVDLGLPSGTLWASYDIGATKVDEFGDFFMWGEVVPRDPNKTWEEKDYKYFSDSGFVKYNEHDKKSVLDSEDDAAISLWGNDWKIPSVTDWKELKMYCDLELRDDSIVLIGPNGNELHFPKYVSCYYEGEDVEFGCDWWSSDIDTSDEYYSIFLANFYKLKEWDDTDIDFEIGADERAYLGVVRPVSKIRANLDFVLPEEDEDEETYEEPSSSSFSMNNEDKAGFNTPKANVSDSSSTKFEDYYTRKNTYIKDGYEKEKTSTLSYILFAIAILMLMFAIFNL